MKILKQSLLMLIFTIAIGGLNSCEKKDSGQNTDTIAVWEELGGTNISQFDGCIQSITTDISCNVYAAGDFYHDNNNKSYVAKWDKNTNSWSKLGVMDSSFFNIGIQYPIATDISGNVYACGVHQVPLINPDYHLVKWEKSTNTWRELGGTDQPSFNYGIYSVVTDDLGNVYVAGCKTNDNNSGDYVSFVTKWDKNTNTWSMLGDSFTGIVFEIAMDATGVLYAAGEFHNSNYSSCVVKWNGSNWSEVGSADFGIGSITALAIDASGNVYAGGSFQNHTHNVAKWNKKNNTWNFLDGITPPYSVYSLAVDVSGNVYAAGNSFNSDRKSYVSKWNGKKWSDFGNLNANNAIYSVYIDAMGNVYAGGMFTNGNNKTYVAVSYR